MYFIILGLSSLTTTSNTGSITQGTSLASQQSLLNMSPTAANMSNLSSTIPLTTLNATPLDLRTHSGVRSSASSPSPTSLQMIQEEGGNGGNVCRNPTRPQISLTDEMGGEITLVPCLSDSSYESNDSIEIHKYEIEDDLMVVDPSQSNTVNVPSFVISGPCDLTRPSIVRGIGIRNDRTKKPSSDVQDSNPEPADATKGNLTSENRRETFAQGKHTEMRLTFPMDRKSNPMNVDDFAETDLTSSNEGVEVDGKIFVRQNRNLLPESTNLVSDFSISTGDIFASELLEKTSSGSFEVRLSKYYSELNSYDILTLVKRIIDLKAPTKCCFLSSKQDLNINDKENGLSLEYPGGVQIELKVCEKSGCEEKGLKLRRISGDQIQYSQLCQQLISCMIV